MQGDKIKPHDILDYNVLTSYELKKIEEDVGKNSI